MTIVLTTHYLDEADSMAERVVVVDHGQVIADDTADGAEGASWPATGVVADRRAGQRCRRSRELVEQLARVPATSVVDGDRGRARGSPTDRRPLPELLRGGPAGAAYRSRRAQVHRPTLDDVFLTLTGRSLREAETRHSDKAAGGRTQHEHRSSIDLPDRSTAADPAATCSGHPARDDPRAAAGAARPVLAASSG